MPRFKTDTDKLFKWLERRKADLAEARSPFEARWREIREAFEPTLGLALDGDDADPNKQLPKAGDEEIYHPEPRALAGKLASYLSGGITNQARSWFELRAKDDRLNERKSVSDWLKKATLAVRSEMAASNAYNALDKIYRQLLFGTAAALVLADDDGHANICVCDCGSYYIGQDRRERVDTLLRVYKSRYYSLEEEFPPEAIPENIRRELDAGHGEKWQKVNHLVCPHRHAPWVTDVKEDMPFLSIYWIDGLGEAGILDIRAFAYNPILAPRWETNTSAYGVGPGEKGLSAAREFQQLEADKSEAVAKENNPAMLASSSMKGEPINTAPGGVTFANFANGQDAPVRRLFETNIRLDAVQQAQDYVLRGLERVFQTEKFEAFSNPYRQKTMTATEAASIEQERAWALGPLLARLNFDLLDVLVGAMTHIAILAGESAPAGGLLDEIPPELADANELDVEFVSSLHVEQRRSAEESSFVAAVSRAGALAQLKPDALDYFDGDEAIKKGLLAANAADLLKEESDVKKARQERAEAAAQEREAALAAQNAAQARDEGAAIASVGKVAPDGTRALLDRMGGASIGGPAA